MKTCGHCRETKPLESFHKKLDGRHGWCKACRSADTAKRREVIDRIKLGAGCADCGYAEHPAALQFDHVRGEKVADVASLRRRGASLERIQAEIAKCEVVCANCHAVRTVKRKQHVNLRWNETATK